MKKKSECMRRGSKPFLVTYVVLFILIFLFLIYKTQFGFANMDEAGTYLSIPYRLCKGDTLILNEWHVSQLSAFLVKPLMSIYLKAAGSTEGIVMSFRIMYTFALALSALFIMKRLSVYTYFGAAAASFMLLLYTPFGIMNFSYNSLGIILLLLSLVIWVTSYSRWWLIVGGLLFAGAVLCCPYLAVMYFLFSILCIFLKLTHWDDKEIFGVWKWGTVGISILSVVFCLNIMLSDTFSISKFVRTLPLILDDPEHQRMSILHYILAYIYKILALNRANRICFPIFAILAVAALLIRREGVRAFCLLAGMLNYIVIIAVTVKETPYPNYLMFPINFLGLLGFLCCRDKLINKIFWGIWVPGMMYSFLITLSSNQAFYAASSASSVSSAVSAIIIVRSIKNLTAGSDKNRMVSSLLIMSVMLVVAAQLSSEAWLRYNQVFWDASPVRLNCRIDAGPEKGILTTEKHKEQYDRYLSDIRDILSDYDVNSVAVVSEKAWLYPCFDREIASYSVWLAGMDDVEYLESRFEQYYLMNPDKIPDLFYIDNKAFYTDLAVSLAAKYGYTILDTDNLATLLLKREISSIKNPS